MKNLTIVSGLYKSVIYSSKILITKNIMKCKPPNILSIFYASYNIVLMLKHFIEIKV